MEQNGEFFERVGTRSAGRTYGRSDAPQAVYEVTKESQIGPTAGGERRWSSNGDAFWGADATHEKLPAGLYGFQFHPNLGITLMRRAISTDGLLHLPDSAGDKVLAEFATFWERRAAFDRYGFLHKRGYLLWGPPGSGKTSTIQLMVRDVIERLNGLVVFVEQPQLASLGLQLIRRIEPERPLMAIMEDVDALVREHGEFQYLAMLDGEAQVGGVVWVATTNYPEMLDRRFVDRPSRFDTIQYVGMPSAEARRLYLQTKDEALTGDELEAWVRHSDGFSIAHLREMIVAVRCLGQPLQDVVARLDAMKERKPTSEDSPDRRRLGFGLMAPQLAESNF
jgi:hypothetical protein